MILDNVAQEAGALMRPFLEYYELLIYFSEDTNVNAWSWAGTTLRDTTHLIGMAGVCDATEVLRRCAPDTITGTLAATYERAAFDLLYHSAMT
jgi:hypothetical protein